MSQQQGQGFPGHSPCLCFHLSISPRCPETRHFTEPLGGCTSGDPGCTQMWVVQFVLTPTYTLSYNSGPQGVSFSNNWTFHSFRWNDTCSKPTEWPNVCSSSCLPYRPSHSSPRKWHHYYYKQFVVAGHAYHAARFYIPHANWHTFKKKGDLQLIA